MNTAALDRFKRLPQIANDIWQGALVRLPVWVGAPGKAQRPSAALWVGLKSGQIKMGLPAKPGEAGLHLVLDALTATGPDQGLQGHRPGQLWVTDPELAQYLKTNLADPDIRIEVVDNDMPIRAVLDHMARSMAGRELPPGALQGTDVTPDRMRRFAEAARLFYLANPWELLTNEDLLHIEHPKPPPGMSHFVVMGAGKQTYGLSFFRSRKQFAEMYASGDPADFYGDQPPVWSVTFGPMEELTIPDADLFEDEALPVAGDNAYPFASAFDFRRERVQRPDAQTLAFLEGLLLTMAQTTEEELDSARWHKHVETAEGPMDFTLTLPDLLDAATQGDQPVQSPLSAFPDRRALERAMRDAWRLIEQQGLTDPDEINAFLEKNVSGKPLQPQPPETPLEAAQDLVYQAAEAQGRRRIQLARKALATSPDCADAYVLLAEHAADPAKACELYRQGLAAAQRALDPELFQEVEGEFWHLLETRPYMRALFGLARCLWEQGNKSEAIENFQNMLRLNPGDNQGARYLLAPALYELGRYDDLQRLLDGYADHAGQDTMLQFMQALLVFKREGDSERARRELGLALKANRYIKKYLTGAADLPEFMPETYTWGSEDEAVLFARDLLPLWQQTEAAIPWLKRQKATPRSAKPKTTPKPKGKRRK